MCNFQQCCVCVVEIFYEDGLLDSLLTGSLLKIVAQVILFLTCCPCCGRDENTFLNYILLLYNVWFCNSLHMYARLASVGNFLNLSPCTRSINSMFYYPRKPTGLSNDSFSAVTVWHQWMWLWVDLSWPYKCMLVSELQTICKWLVVWCSNTRFPKGASTQKWEGRWHYVS